MFDVDFDNPAPQLICHPSLRVHENLVLGKLNPFFLRDHFILFSSGTTGGDLKGYALSRKALFTNAEAVNEHFGLTKDDVWGLSLPVYHVGGLSVLARAHILKNKVVDLRQWDPETWTEKTRDVTITTIVPTQLYDLVKRNLKPSPSLRFLIVGGDFLSTKLKEDALKLGWPVIRTFGMSEVCSQLASAKTPESDDLIILSPHEVRIEDERLLVKSKALFTLEFSMGEKFRISTAGELSSADGYYYTKDRAEVSGRIIKPLGRIGDEFKSSGHLINLNQLKETLGTFLLEKNLFNGMELLVEDDERAGKKLVLLVLKSVHKDSVVQELQLKLAPVKVSQVRILETFQRTDLGKLKKQQS